MNLNNLHTTILKAYRQDIENDTLSFLSIFLDKLIEISPEIDAGYIALVDHDVWAIHTYQNINFDSIKSKSFNTLKNNPFFSENIPLFNKTEQYFSYNTTTAHGYITDSIASFYEHFNPDIRAEIVNLHQKWKTFSIIPFYMNQVLLGHMILCFKKQTNHDIISQLIQDLTTCTDLITICLQALKKDRYAYDLEAIINTSISIASTYSLTGQIHTSFLSTLLRLAMKHIPEVDYGSSIIISNGLWLFDDAIGHDVKALRSIPVTRDLYETNMLKIAEANEVDKDVYIINNILASDHYIDESDSYKSTIFSRIAKASLPIKTSMQVNIKNRGHLRGIICLDIAPNNPLTFSKKSIKILKRIGQIASMFFSYNTLYDYTESFTMMTELISRFMSSADKKDNQFFNDFLKLTIQSIPEANYASIYLRRGGSIYFVDAIGHNAKILKQLSIKDSYYHVNSIKDIDSNDPIPFTISRNIQEDSMALMPSKLREQYMAAVKPIKETMICHYRLTSDTIMDIALDIGRESLMSYSNESIKMFQAFSNIGFAFMAHKTFSEKIMDLNESIESHIEKTESLKNQNQVLEVITRTDGLTNIYNHTYIIHLLQNEIKLSKSENMPLSIILFDIDNFKEINDKFGHVTGDHVLMSVASILNQKSPSIHAGRYGGEEFLCVLPHYKTEEALAFAEMIRRQIETTLFDKDLSISISGGIATWHGDSVSDFIREADQFLYEAKNHGRNKICYKLQ